MKCSSCRGSSNLQFTNSTDDGVDRMAVSQGILFMCVLPRCFRSSLKHCRSRITAVNAFTYTNVLTICYAPLCLVMLLHRFSFSMRTRISLMSVDKKNQLDVTFCILYFSSNSCSTCFGKPCAHHQELTTA